MKYKQCSMIELQLEYIPIIFSADNMMPEIPTPAAEATSSSKPIIFSLTERTLQIKNRHISMITPVMSQLPAN